MTLLNGCKRFKSLLEDIVDASDRWKTLLFNALGAPERSQTLLLTVRGVAELSKTLLFTALCASLDASASAKANPLTALHVSLGITAPSLSPKISAGVFEVFGGSGASARPKLRYSLHSVFLSAENLICCTWCFWALASVSIRCSCCCLTHLVLLSVRKHWY